MLPKACLLMLALLLWTEAPSRGETPAPNPSATNSAEPAPGTAIDQTNAEKYARYLPAAAMFAIKHGFKIDVVPTTRIDWPEGYKQATERYSRQVSLDANDIIQNYVAGAAFPTVEATDPHAAIKISYNWRWGPFVFDDYTMSNPRIAYYTVDANQPIVLTHRDVNDMTASKCALLRFAHRVAIDPRPLIEPNPQGAELKIVCEDWSDLRHEDTDGVIHSRFLDPSKPDENFYHSRTSRRLRRSDSKFEGEFWGWQDGFFFGVPKTEVYTWKLLGTTTLLGCVNAAHDPAVLIPDSQPAKLLQEPFQLRNVWILERSPRDPKWKDDRVVAYIDTETYLELADEFYQGAEQTAVSAMLWHQAAGQGAFFLAGEIQRLPAGRTYLTGGMSSDSNGESFYFYLPGAGSQKINTGGINDEVFNPNALQ
jgi:hypothetical protein